WWIGTDQGLIRALPEKSGYVFKRFQVVSGEINSIQATEVTSLLTDPLHPHILWIATNGGGLSRLDTRTGIFSHFNTRTGFPDNVIYGILNDKRGRLWMSSNRGLIRLNPATGRIRQYTIQDGLPAIEFNTRTFAKRPDGSMLFGCLKGLIDFNPDEFEDNPVTPQVRITGLEVNNQSVVFGDSFGVLQQAIEYTDRLELPFSQNSITLKFAALEFSTPKQNQFQYYLKGAEPEWAHRTTENTASYLNLAPGRYTFLVKGSNGDGVWNETPTTLQIIILPPWYRTTWAYIVYALLLLGLGYGLLRFFLHRQRLQYKLTLEQREAERLKELDTFKSQVFTNITHEFRTPLTVIQGMAERMVNSEGDQPKSWVQQTGTLIKRNGTALLRLINQLLDLAKLEANTLTLNLELTDLVPFVKYLAGSFQSLAADKHIQLDVQIDRESIPMAIDKDQVQTILYNLLTNAVKFTPINGRILLQIDCLDDWQNNLGAAYFRAVIPPDSYSGEWVSIRVQDSGAGITPERLPHIFDRFYQSATKEGGGSGIGLALVKELVQLMEGALAVRSEPDQGTEFVALLPVREMEPGNETPANLESVHFPERIEHAASADPVVPVQPDTDDLPALLIVEDNPDVRHYLLSCVEGAYRVSTAFDGRQGIETALELVPDIIISDVMMPIKDGFEVVNTLKNDERTSHIPIILLTAKADLDSRLEGLERGADAYLAKPFDRAELLVWLRKLLELRRKLQQRYAGGPLPDVSSEAPEEGMEAYEDAFMRKVQAVLDAEMHDEDFGVQELCRALFLGRTQLHNKLKALTGKSTTLYIRSVRLHKARQLLISSDMTVSEAAFEVGFRHLQHFSTSFAEEFGMPPSSLRK
ncbi:MAG: response regulator, partial [Lewinellaceae bacterium]|nr:response regulator [Lewinellaceae bacterium]